MRVTPHGAARLSFFCWLATTQLSLSLSAHPHRLLIFPRPRPALLGATNEMAQAMAEQVQQEQQYEEEVGNTGPQPLEALMVRARLSGGPRNALLAAPS